jgi:glutathione S-transferase
MLREPLRMIGVPGSPYSRKLRAVMRYRRIPHVWSTQGAVETRTLPQPPVALLPQLFVPGADGELEARIDSTPLIRQLEDLQPGRSVIPPDAALAFIDALLEDYADEWLTKAMFHYRWAFASDIANAAAILPRWFRNTQPDREADAAGKMFAQRQIGRLAVVGSSPATAPLIEASYVRALHLLDARLAESPFIFGKRPAAADFAVFGQLTQLTAFDPTPAAIARKEAPRVVAWVDLVEDLSGIEPTDRDWMTRDAVAPTVRALLQEVGRVYAPFLIANAGALARGSDRVECLIDGQGYSQRPFPYQAKCLAVLRNGYGALSGDDRHAVDALLAGTGCVQLFSS